MAAVSFCVAACDQKSAPTAQATPEISASSGDGAATTAAAPSNQPQVIFGDGFHKEEASPNSTLRWVQGNAALRIVAPAGGRYRLTFRPFTVFTTVEDTVDLSVNGQPAGSFSTKGIRHGEPGVDGGGSFPAHG